MLRIFIVLFFMILPVFCIAEDTEDQLKTFLQSREVVDQVYFETSSTLLTPSSRDHLDRLASRLNDMSNSKTIFRVEGFSSPDGPRADNVNLALGRAMEVRNYLGIQHGLDLEIFLTGFVETDDPEVDPNKLRRVDIAIYKRPESASALFDDQGTVEKIVLQ